MVGMGRYVQGCWGGSRPVEGCWGFPYLKIQKGSWFLGFNVSRFQGFKNI